MIEKETLDDLYTTVRGVRVPTLQIQQIEDSFGAKLVHDDNPKLLLALDDTLERYMLSHNNKVPDLVVLREQPEVYYKPMVLNINFLGTEIPGSYRKPGWFMLKRVF